MKFLKDIDIKQLLKTFIIGFSMGTADLVPGVSGGTVAFITGIYNQLLDSIKIATGDFIKLLLKFKIKDAFQVVPFSFLVPLGVGILGAIFLLAKPLVYLLVHQPVYIWSFFFGLVIASTLVVLRRIEKYTATVFIGFIIAMLISYFVVGAIPIETPENPLTIFLSGMLAICAMILPGISGSFILLLLGKYQQVLGAVKDFDVVTLGIFFIGCIAGLAIFARFLSWLLKKHYNVTIAVLAGIMFGSLRKLWPWKEIILTRTNSHGEEVPLAYNNILPGQFDASVIIAITLCIIGIAIVGGFEKWQMSKERID